jgi:electron transfer flavoprotein alpha subunit
MTPRPIWIYGDLRTARHWRDSLKVLAKALAAAAKDRTPVGMVLMGAPAGAAQQASQFDLSSCVDIEDAAGQALAQGAHSAHCLMHPHLSVPRSDVHAGVLSEFATRRSPWLILFPLNDFGRETAAICAQNCSAGLIAECAELIMHDGRFIGRCPAWGGQIMADIALADGWPTGLVTVQPHGIRLPSPGPIDGRRVERIVLDQVRLSKGAKMVGRVLEAAGKRRMEDADVVVVGGAGLGDMRTFGQVRELAAALGGEVGATRPPVLYHWVDEDRLIGQTGKTVRPKLLLSVGASGAVQYTAGIMEADTIVAVNRDPAAPIFQIADIGITADASVFLPLMNQRAQQLAMQRLADVACGIDSPGSTATSQGATGRGNFGGMVCRLREARDWSREELAQATGQTPEFIEQVENDQLSPPVGFIMRMARAMQIDPGTFLQKEEQTAIRDRRAQAYYQRTQSYSYTTLTQEAANNHLRAFMVTIEAHHDHKPVAYKHEGEEFIYVMDGDLGLTLGAKDHVLKPGESIHFNSDVAHKLKSLSSRPTRCLVVLYTL